MRQNVFLRLAAFMLIVAIIFLMVAALFGYVKVLNDVAAAIFSMMSGGPHG